MVSFPAHITDPVFVEPAQYGWLDRKLLNLIRDRRDLVFPYLMAQISLTLIPLAVALYALPAWGVAWWGAAVLYFLLNNFRFKGPFGLMMHCTSHRVLFANRYAFWNNYIPWVLGPLFGQTPETYYTHHIGMHHPENNMEEDESSTMPYQRDSVRGFLLYFTNFLFLGVFQTQHYLKRKKRFALRMRLIRGELLFLSVCGLLCLVNTPATLMVFILPFFISRIIMMLGNWTQHAFVSPTDPGNMYQNTITCINTKYNHKCWNDGYHTAHHIKSGIHYTEYPGHLQANLETYAANEAIVFEGVHYLHIFSYLMRKRYDLLARHFVNLGGFENDEAVKEFLKSRTVAIR